MEAAENPCQSTQEDGERGPVGDSPKRHDLALAQVQGQAREGGVLPEGVLNNGGVLEDVQRNHGRVVGEGAHERVREDVGELPEEDVSHNRKDEGAERAPLPNTTRDQEAGQQRTADLEDGQVAMVERGHRVDPLLR